ncbi:pitrilysin family protein [Lentzea sp. BCCO 10_0798]|uniref:Pitrilysin family protein n=1 Tax=Lentzea kristufekii TaxID=3095430 RepID=A0ABU4TRK9_9PSEU|nr:pitrilysin family protein [Lentzea sp. BCCO 10_0798]MDX8050906.1 pitrilysin family protein [Lentzea sp. BCCO 10_0798]
MADPVLTVSSEVRPDLRTTGICLTVALGSRTDPPELGGLTHLLEHLVMSAPLDGRSFSARTEWLGGSVNAHTGLEEQQFYARVRAEDADAVIALLLRAAFAPDLSDAAVTAESAVVLRELAASAADPNEVVQDAVLAALFHGHPLGRPVGGTPAGIRAANPDAVRAHHATRFLGAPAHLAVVGPHPPVLPRGGPAVTPLGSTAPHITPEPLPPLVAGPVRWPEDFAWVCLGARSPGAGDPRRPGHDVLAALLGSSPSSLLYRRLREELGLGYAFEAWDRGYTEAGAWRVLAGAGEGDGAQVVDVVRDLLADLAGRGPADEDLDAARRGLQMRLLVDSEDPLEAARSLGVRTRAGTAPWSAEEQQAAIRAVTAEDVAAAARAVCAGLITVVRPEGRPR